MTCKKLHKIHISTYIKYCLNTFIEVPVHYLWFTFALQCPAQVKTTVQSTEVLSVCYGGDFNFFYL